MLSFSDRPEAYPGQKRFESKTLPELHNPNQKIGDVRMAEKINTFVNNPNPLAYYGYEYDTKKPLKVGIIPSRYTILQL